MRGGSLIVTCFIMGIAVGVAMARWIHDAAADSDPFAGETAEQQAFWAEAEREANAYEWASQAVGD